MPLASWRLVGRRSLADRMVVSVAWLVMVAAVTLLAAGAMYSDAVARAGLLRTLSEAGPTAGAVQASALVEADAAAAADEVASRAITAALGPAAGDLVRIGRSESFALPDQPADGTRNLAVLEFAERIEEHATLLEGAWPAAGGEPMAVAVSRPVADALGLAVGSEVDLTSRLSADLLVGVTITGIYQVNERSDPYWWGDPLELEGLSVAGTFNTYGPFIAAREDVIGRAIVHRVDLTWRAFPDLSSITSNDIDGLRNRLGGLQRRLGNDIPDATSVDVATELPALLAGAGSSLLVSRAGVLLLNIQLAVLAGYALLLVGALIVEQRRAETALLRSRGASTFQLLRYSVMEALLLVVPAAIAAPVLALGVLAVFEAVGPLRDAGLSLRPQLTRDAIVIGGLACLISLLALALPGLAGFGPLAGVRRAVGRQFQATLPQRLGLDLALVVMALIGLWQLQQYGAPLTRTLRGSLGVDPLLIAAPTIGLVAGAVLALRILPLLARGLEDLVARRQGMGSALGARQLARRPLRYTRAALLLMVASAIGIFAMTYAATWALSQRDQVDYAVGSDVRLDARNSTAEPWQAGAALAAIPGVAESMPVLRESFQLGRAGGRGELIAIDPAAAGAVVRLRPDMSDLPVESAMAGLIAARAPLALPAVPAGTVRLAVDLDADLAGVPTETGTGEVPAEWTGIRIALVARDVAGHVHRVEAVDPVGIGTHGVEFPLTTEAAAAGGGQQSLVRPVTEIVGLEVAVRPPSGVALAGSIAATGLRAGTGAAGGTWSDIPFDPAAAGWETVQIDANGLPTPVVASDRPGAVTFDEDLPLGGNSEVRFGLRPESLPGSPQAPVPALVDPEFLDASGLLAGDQIEIGEQFSTTRRIVVAGRLRGFPTAAPENLLAVVDLPSLALSDYATRNRLAEPREWWLSAPAIDLASAGVALTAQPIGASTVLSRADALDARLGDPIALGVVGALVLGSIAAWFFAGLGFIVSAVVAARERLSEFALLRALGLSRRQLHLSLSLENGFLLLLSLLVGVGLGVLLAWVVLPSVTLTPEGTPPLPAVRVALPWDVLAVLFALGLGLLLVTLIVLRRLADRDAMAALLRLREE